MRYIVYACSVVALTGSAVLMGCATTDDPRQGGLFSYNPAAYERRLEQRRASLRKAEEERRRLETETQHNQLAIQQKQARIAQLEYDLARLDHELATTRLRIEQYTAKTADKQRDKQKAQKQLSALTAQLEEIKANQQLSVEEKNRTIAELKKEINDLVAFATQMLQ